jgi:hypothetical protein
MYWGIWLVFRADRVLGMILCHPYRRHGRGLVWRDSASALPIEQVHLSHCPREVRAQNAFDCDIKTTLLPGP